MNKSGMLNHRSVFHVDFVAEQDKWKVLWITRSGLYQELITPAVECLERARCRDVIDEYAAVRATVECDTEALEALLTSRVPDLTISGPYVIG